MLYEDFYTGLAHALVPKSKMQHIIDYGGTVIEDKASEWLYGEWSEEKLHQFEFLSNVPFVGNYLDYLLDKRADEEYLRRYGLDYSDIHDPRKLRQTSSGSRLAGSSLNFVSKNVTRLYR